MIKVCNYNKLREKNKFRACDIFCGDLIWSCRFMKIMNLDLLKSYFNSFLDNNNKLICINNFLIKIKTKILLFKQ